VLRTARLGSPLVPAAAPPHPAINPLSLVLELSTQPSQAAGALPSSGALISAAPLYRRFVAVDDISSHASIGSLCQAGSGVELLHEGMVLPADSLVE